MYTLGYSFKPWRDPQAIADGGSILAYIRETAVADGTDRAIRYGHRVVRARWSSADASWLVDIAGRAPMRCSFLYLCTGYYDYAGGYTPDFAGRERFRGRIVHPQLWTDDIDYADKRVVVIGSGATAVTLVPELAKRAAHVTMLQRSPTYILALPSRDRIADWLRAQLPARSAYALTRWKNVLLGMAFYNYARRYPARAKQWLVGAALRQLPDLPDAAQHFTPSYNVWDQRLCLAPDGDLFRALRAGTASVVTDHVATFTETGIALASGAHLAADLVVTATGLRLQFFGGVALEVDGRAIDPPATMVYKGSMVSGVPNLAFASGYTNASWTLKCDLTAIYVCRLLAHMERHGYTRCMPRRAAGIGELPLLDFSSGYIQRALPQLPKQGAERPWRLYQNWALDRVVLEAARVDEPALELT